MKTWLGMVGLAAGMLAVTGLAASAAETPVVAAEVKPVVPAVAVDSAKIPAATGVPSREVRQAVCGAVVVAERVNVLPRPDANLEMIGAFKKGETLQVFGEMGTWLEVAVPAEVEAWVAGVHVAEDGKVNVDRLRVHAGPSALHPVFGFVYMDELVKKVGESSGDGWQKISATAGMSGWVRKSQVKLDGGAATLPVVAPAEFAESAGTEPGAAEGGTQTEAATAAAATEKPVATAPAATQERKADTNGKTEEPKGKPETPVTDNSASSSVLPSFRSSTAAVAAAAPTAVAAPAPGSSIAIVRVNKPASAPVAAPAVPLVPGARPGVMIGSVVNVRAVPGTSYEVIAKFKHGDTVQVVGERGDWFQVVLPAGATGWVGAKFLDADCKVIPTQLRVRSGATPAHSDYHMLKRGELVKKIGEPTKDGWQKIEAPVNAAGWVKKEFVKVEAVAGVVATPVTPADKVAVAESATPVTPPVTANPGTPVVPVNPVTAVVPATPDSASPVSGKLPPAVVDQTLSPALPAGTIIRPFMAPYAGVVKSLGAQASAAVTHLLMVQEGTEMKPVAYLISKRVALGEWEGRKVKITEGKEIWYPGWKRQVLTVTGVEAAD